MNEVSAPSFCTLGNSMVDGKPLARAVAAIVSAFSVAEVKLGVRSSTFFKCISTDVVDVVYKYIILYKK